MRHAKLFAAIRANSKRVRFEDACRAARLLGFVHEGRSEGRIASSSGRASGCSSIFRTGMATSLLPGTSARKHDRQVPGPHHEVSRGSLLERRGRRLHRAGPRPARLFGIRGHARRRPCTKSRTQWRPGSRPAEQPTSPCLSRRPRPAGRHDPALSLACSSTGPARSARRRDASLDSPLGREARAGLSVSAGLDSARCAPVEPEVSNRAWCARIIGQ